MLAKRGTNMNFALYQTSVIIYKNYTNRMIDQLLSFCISEPL